MNFDSLKSGAVILYPYLWHREADRGETEGRKLRPAAVAVRIARPGKPDTLVLFPVTTKQPEAGRFMAEIPEMEKRRAGLDTSLRQWIILDEANEEIWPGSYYLEPRPPLGAFSKKFSCLWWLNLFDGVKA